MVKCNNNYECNNDIVTYEDITEENVNQCIALDNDKCTLCESIKFFNDNNRSNLNKDPTHFIFGKSEPEKNDEFWKLVKEKCGIVKDNTQNEIQFTILEPDYEKLEITYDSIKNKIYDNKTNSYKFIDTLYKIAKRPSLINLIEYNQERFYRDIKNILETDNCSSQMIHKADELPFNVGLFFNELANTNNEIFCQVIEFLNNKPQVCLEAVIEHCLKIINSEIDKYRKKYLKYKHKYILLKNIK